MSYFPVPVLKAQESLRAQYKEYGSFSLIHNEKRNFAGLAVYGITAVFVTVNFVKHQWRVAYWLVTCARKPKVLVSSPAVSYVQS